MILYAILLSIGAVIAAILLLPLFCASGAGKAFRPMFYSYAVASAVALSIGVIFMVRSYEQNDGGSGSSPMSPVGSLFDLPQLALASGLFVGLPLFILTLAVGRIKASQKMS